LVIHDYAHQLARALSNSEEYRQYVEAKTMLEKEEQNRKMLEDFRQQQWELQVAQMTGQEIDERKIQQMEKLYEVLSLNPVISQFLNAEYRLARLMGDIQKIVSDATPAWFDFGGRRSLVN